MDTSFERLWQAMETRRWQFEAGAVPLPYHPEHLCQEQQQARGCPTEEGSERPQSSFEPTTNGNAIQPILWGD